MTTFSEEHKSENEKLLARSAFKEKLDSISSSTVNVSTMREILETGPEREFVIHKNGVFLNMVGTRTKYFWDVNDPRTAITCLAAFGVYEEVESRILRRIASESSVIVDIGANVGYYTVELGKLLRKGGTLLSFEPVRETYLRLEENVGLNELGSIVKLFDLGLSNTDHQATIFLPEESGSSAASLRNLHPDEKVGSQEIKVTTLDKIFEVAQINECSLIKIDVEGGELQVIQGALNTIKKFKPIIFAELLRKWSAAFSYTPNDVLDLLEKLDYLCFGVSDEIRRVSRFQDSDIETNYIFIHKDKMHLNEDWLNLA